MGFRFIRIGNKSVGEIQTLSFRRSLKNSAVILYVIALWAIYIVVRLMGYDISSWADFIFSLLSVITCFNTLFIISPPKINFKMVNHNPLKLLLLLVPHGLILLAL